jgi:phosphoenolpyruvate carboxykinase (ATP)
MFDKNIKARRICSNPSAEELREFAKFEERKTKYGSACYITKVRSRSAKNTYIIKDRELHLGVGQQSIEVSEAVEIIGQVRNYLKGKEVISMDKVLGKHPESRFSCRLYITKESARIPYMWDATLFPAELNNIEPDLVTVYVPEWPERKILVHPVEGITYILGTDYFGECKKSFLRMAMYRMKSKGCLGLHAGSKVIKIKDRMGNLREVGFIMFGLSGTGKTTLTIHDHDLKGEEGIIIRQDDVVFLNDKGYCYGTENGFFFKTEGLEPSQKVLYQAATREDCILENVWVDDSGEVDFSNLTLTSNGRGVVSREKVIYTDDEVDLKKADKIIFITRRNDIVPPVAKLNPQQAAAFFVLGESIETSAGDPTRAGQSKREVGTNPFIIGPEADEGNRFLEILKKNPDIECFLLNTGSVGAKGDFKGEKITIKVTTEIMKQIAKGAIDWKVDPCWGYQVPAKVEGLNIAQYNPERFYTGEEYEKMIENLRKERREWLARFPGLYNEILDAI